MTKHNSFSTVCIKAAAWCLLLFLIPVAYTEAASLYMSPGSGSYTVGQTIPVGIYVSSVGKPVNATGLTVSYDTSVFDAVSVTTGGSVIDFWAQEPSISAGQAVMEGVTFSGYDGNAGRIATLNLRAKKQGTGAVQIATGEVLAHDGLGTKISTSLGTASFTVRAAAPAVPSPELTPTPVADDQEEVATGTEATGTPEYTDEAFSINDWIVRHIWILILLFLVLLVIDSFFGFYFYRKWRDLLEKCIPRQ